VYTVASKINISIPVRSIFFNCEREFNRCSAFGECQYSVCVLSTILTAVYSSIVNLKILMSLLRMFHLFLPLLPLLLLPTLSQSNTCTYTKRPWAPQPLVCTGCSSGWISTNMTTSKIQQHSSDTFSECLPCKVVREGCALCGIVKVGKKRPMDCVDSMTSSTVGEWPKPNGTYHKPKKIIITIDNDGYSPGAIMFKKLKHDPSFDWKDANVCQSMRFDGLDYQNGPNFECVCDISCGKKEYVGEIGRCTTSGNCQRCDDGWSTRGDYTMFTNCVVFEPIQTLCWIGVIASSLVTLIFSIRKSYEIFRLRKLWMTYFATISPDHRDDLPEDIPLSVKISIVFQDIFYLLWKHDDGIFLLLAMIRSFIQLFFVSIPKVAIGGQGTEIGFNRFITAAVSITSIIDCFILPEIIMLYLTRWIKLNIPRRNPFRLHVILKLHQSFDSSYKRVRPFYIFIAFSGPWIILLTNLSWCNGTYGEDETRIIPYKDQYTLSLLLSVFIRCQYIALASLQFWVCFICSAKAVYVFNEFSNKVKKTSKDILLGCKENDITVNDNDNNQDDSIQYLNNITDPRKTLKEIQIASSAIKKLAFLVLVASSCVGGYYAVLVVIEPIRQLVSFVVAPINLTIDVLVIQIVSKIRPKPRRLNGSEARRYIKLGNSLSGVKHELGAFDERVDGDVDSHVASSGIDSSSGSGLDEDYYEDEDNIDGICSCCESKSTKLRKRRERKKKRRLALRQQHLQKQRLESAKVRPLSSNNGISYEDPHLYSKLNISESLLKKFKKEFQKIDVDNSQSISFKEFLKYYEIAENASFIRRLFLSFQVKENTSKVILNSNGKAVITKVDINDEDLLLYFQDFVLGLWNYLVMTKGQVILKAFELYDDDQSNSLDISELKEMVFDIWGKNASIEHSRINYIIKNLDPDGSGDCDMHEWLAACKKNPILTKPIVNAQRILREKCFGLIFWIDQQKKDVAQQQAKIKAGKS
jgi:Ca2+-binding EF-hand superfamily protein